MSDQLSKHRKIEKAPQVLPPLYYPGTYLIRGNATKVMRRREITCGKVAATELFVILNTEKITSNIYKD